VANLETEDVVAWVKDITHGRGVNVVYDSVGRDTFAPSLECLAPRGMMVSFGQSSGPPPPLDVKVLAQKGSLFLTRPALQHYIATRQELLEGARALFEVVRKGAVQVEVRQRFPLEKAAEAHGALQERRTTGSSVLLP
jgi:NADPH2:quinone reductase